MSIVLLCIAILATFAPAMPCQADTPAPKADAKIEALIDQLTQVDQEWSEDGLARRDLFVAVDDRPPIEKVNGWLSRPISPAFRSLVEKGAVALPALIAHLNDSRPTETVIEHSHPMGGMGLTDEYDPKANGLKSPFLLPDWHKITAPPMLSRMMKDRDSEAIQEQTAKGSANIQYFPVDVYTMRVGDLCYLAIGQIVNRNLLPLHFRPEAIFDINSPVFMPEIAEAVKRDWGNMTAESLRESLLRDARSYDESPANRGD
ncbi:MAG TPA: hypothetical protein VFW40_11470 [Capsulimonadaceae bacterium]|nr:hypothetical protein [Capsulimonadaceae bacterium]